MHLTSRHTLRPEKADRTATLAGLSLRESGQALRDVDHGRLSQADFRRRGDCLPTAISDDFDIGTQRIVDVRVDYFPDRSVAQSHVVSHSVASPAPRLRFGHHLAPPRRMQKCSRHGWQSGSRLRRRLAFSRQWFLETWARTGWRLSISNSAQDQTNRPYQAIGCMRFFDSVLFPIPWRHSRLNHTSRATNCTSTEVSRTSRRAMLTGNLNRRGPALPGLR